MAAAEVAEAGAIGVEPGLSAAEKREWLRRRTTLPGRRRRGWASARGEGHHAGRRRRWGSAVERSCVGGWEPVSSTW